jgi:hypothetical protein
MGLFNWLFRRRAKPLPHGEDAARGVRPDHPQPALAQKPPPHGDNAASSVLAEAGCADAPLLEHLRSPGPHVRGCWALDLVLAKK